MNIMNHGKVLHILDLLQHSHDADEDAFERTLDQIEEVI